MRDLSLHLLDLAQNSISAGASLVSISIVIDANGMLTFILKDDGHGMPPELLERVKSPFATTRTTRKVGMGIPLLKMAAEQTGGGVTIQSRHEDDHPDTHGTEVVATFYTDHIDFTPIGDLVSTMETLIMGSPNIDFVFAHRTDAVEVELDTREVREVLGADVPLDSFEVIQWIGQYLQEQYDTPRV